MDLKRRIKRNEQFKEIIDKHDCLKLKSCNIYFKKSSNKYLFGISVSKKLGNAVVRNLTKRRIRACLKDIIDEKYINNYDFIIIAKPLILNMKYNEFYLELEKALNSRFIGE